MKSAISILIAAAALALGATYGAVQGPSGEAAGGKGAADRGVRRADHRPACPVIRTETR